jgi:TolA-binding protein
MEQEKPDDARPVFVRLASSYPEHALAPAAAFRAAEIEYAAGSYEAAAERYRFAAASKSEVAGQAAYKLACALARSGDRAGAAEAFAQAAVAFPTGEFAAEARVRAGEGYLALGRLDPALEQFEAVLSASAGAAEPGGLAVQARVGAAQARLARGDCAAAIELAEKAAIAENGPYGARALLTLANATLQKDGARAALPRYVKGVSTFPDHPELAAEFQFRAGECYEKLGDAEAARYSWTKVRELYAGTEWAARSKEKLEALKASDPAVETVRKATAGVRSETRSGAPTTAAPAPAAAKPAPGSRTSAKAPKPGNKNSVKTVRTRSSRGGSGKKDEKR